jgi:hypothetical protein
MNRSPSPVYSHMKEKVKGHVFELDNLRGTGTTTLQFHMDPDLHEGQRLEGPSMQEVLRSLIRRIQRLDEEQHFDLNDQAIQKAREMIAIFEARALIRKVEKGQLNIEELPVGEDGHIILKV